MTKETIKATIADVLSEINELEMNQHPSFYRDEPTGRERMALLLLKLNALEELGNEQGLPQKICGRF